MKKNNFIKRALVAAAFALAVAVLVPATGSVEAQAAKKVTAQKNWKKAPTVKTGTTVVTVKKKPKNLDALYTYVKFKAPKKGTYTFTVSSIKIKGEKPANSIACGDFIIQKPSADKKYLNSQKVKTEGGKTAFLAIGTKEMYEFSKSEGEKKVNQFLTKRTGTLKLKKRETVYIMFYLISDKQYTYNLKIKKK